MTEQQPQRLSAEREAYLRQEADDCSSTASSWLPELLAELDAVREERDRCIATRKEEIKYLVPTQQTESLHADLAAANERIRTLETGLHWALSGWERDSSALARIHATHPHLGYGVSADTQATYRDLLALAQAIESEVKS